MDKQIMDLTAAVQAASLKSTTTPPNNNSDYIDLVNHRRMVNDEDEDDDCDNLKKEDIVQSSTAANSAGVSRVSNSIISPPPPIKNYGYLDSFEPVRGTFSFSKDRSAHDGSLLPEIDGIMKKYTDKLLHVLEGVSARMTQLEISNLKNLVDDINVAVGNNYGSTDGKMWHLENNLLEREVQTGVQVLRDEHKIIEAQLELSKLQVSHTLKANTAGSSSALQTISAPLQETAPQHQVPSTPQQGYQQLPLPALPPSFSMPQNAVVPTPQSQPLAPPLQMPNQLPHNQVPRPSQYPPHGQTQEAPNQHYQHTPTQQPPPPPPHPSSAPLPQYPGSYSPYSQPPQQQTSMPPFGPQGLPPAIVNQEEASYIPSQSYGPPPHQPLSHPPSAGSQSQQYYGPPSRVYDLPPPRSNMGYPSSYAPPAGPNEPSTFWVSPTPNPFSFGAASTPVASTTHKGSPFEFTAGSSTLPLNSTTGNNTSTAQPLFGRTNPFSLTSAVNSKNQTSVDDIMEEDSKQASPSAFGVQQTANTSTFGFTSPNPTGASNSFQYASQPNLANPSPFQSSGSQGGIFYLGSYCCDKSTRKIIKPKKGVRRK